MFLMKTALALIIALLAVFQGVCHQTPPSVTCGTARAFILRGTCIALTNPCADNREWETTDTFRFDDAPGLTVKVNPSPGFHSRQLCAAADAPTQVDHPFRYIYSRRLAWGDGSLIVDIPGEGGSIDVNVDANPRIIDEGGTAQLSARVSGDFPPFSYEWVPGSSLSDPHIGNPVATPTNTTPYTLTVTDIGGNRASAQVILKVRMTATTTASPATINPGQSSQLDSTVTGGRPPYNYSWFPSNTLQGSNTKSPIATPTSTTTYSVFIFDSNTDPLSDSVTVTVNAPTPTPTPTEADLALFISDSADPVPRLGPLTLTFLVTNNGPLAATNVLLSYPLPLGTELSSNFFPSQGSCTLSLTNILTCNFGTIASGNSATLPLPIFSLTPGLMTSSATVVANESDPNPSNNTDTETTTVNGP